MNRRTFIKAAAAGGFLPTFATLAASPKTGEAADVRVGLIGFGGDGCLLATAISRISGVRVRCVCDIWKFQRQRARAFFKQYGQEVADYEDYREMLDKEDANIDAVVVATPDWMHCEQVCACLARGKHVYCEAPLADTLEGAAKMSRAAKKSKRLLQIGFQRRSSRRYRLGFEQVIPEMLGGMKLIRAQWAAPLMPLAKVKKPPKPELLAKYGYESVEQYLNWMWFRKFGEGPVASLMPHQVDLFSWAWNSQPTAVTAVGSADLFNPRREVLDSLTCLYEFNAPDGTTRLASHQYTALNSDGGTHEEYVGTRATLVLGGYPLWGNYVRRSPGYWCVDRDLVDNKDASWASFVKKGWILPSEGDKRELSTNHDIYDCLPTDFADVREWDNPLSIKSEDQPYVLHLKNFLAAIQGEESLNCPPERAYAATVAVHGAIRSARQRATVYFKPEDFKVPEAKA